MTSVEKQRVLERVMASNVASQSETTRVQVKSSWTVFSFGSWIESHRWVSAVAVVIIVIVAGNSAVLASYDALPGDALYSVKVDIVEPIRVALAQTPLAKAEVQAQQVQTRLQEAETLAAQGSLTEAKEQEINQRVLKQSSDLAINVSSVKETAPEKAQDIDTTIQASLNTHERILGVIAANRGQSRSERTTSLATNRAVKKMSEPKPAEDVKTEKEEKVTIVARAIPPVESRVASTPAAVQSISAPTAPSIPVGFTGTPVVAPVSAGASVTSAPSEIPVIIPASSVVPVAPIASARVQKVVVREIKKNPEYEKKKAALQSLIQTTSAQIAIATSTATSSPVQNAIINDAKATLEQAQDELRDADMHDQNGEVDQSYSTLVDSERSTKEAGLLIEANARFKKSFKRK